MPLNRCINLSQCPSYFSKQHLGDALFLRNRLLGSSVFWFLNRSSCQLTSSVHRWFSARVWHQQYQFVDVLFSADGCLSETLLPAVLVLLLAPIAPHLRNERKTSSVLSYQYPGPWIISNAQSDLRKQCWSDHCPRGIVALRGLLQGLKISARAYLRLQLFGLPRVHIRDTSSNDSLIGLFQTAVEAKIRRVRRSSSLFSRTHSPFAANRARSHWSRSFKRFATYRFHVG